MTLRLSAKEVTVLAEAIDDAIKSYISPSTGCMMCRGSSRDDDGRIGCQQHSHQLAVLRALRRRLS